MKQSLFIFLMTAFPLIQLHAQEEHRYFPTGMKWKEVIAEPYYLPLDTVFSFIYEIGEDTLVDGKSCKSVIMNDKPLEQWVYEENNKVWVITEDYPDPIMIYDFNWNGTNPYYEYLRVYYTPTESEHETELVRSYLDLDGVGVTISNNQAMEYLMDYEGALIRQIGRVSDMYKDCLLGYKIIEPVPPSFTYSKVLWIIRDGQEIFRSEKAEEWTVNIPDNTDGTHDVPVSIFNPHNPNPPYFDLSGRRLITPPAHGIYIRGGRKYVK